jgi:tetratricopeptide (TPR) repeat protein
LDEAQALEDAMHAATHMMNDDMDLAEEELAKGDSCFHKLGIGVASFMRATLGFEKEIMKQAAERLYEAEVLASEQLRKAQRYPDASKPRVYSPGMEYALCVAEVQIMGAVIGVLTESLTEALKGFYKLRKAYMTLNGILEEEKRYLDSRGARSPDPSDPTPNGTESLESSVASEPVESSESSTPVPPIDTPLSNSSEDEFFDADEDTDLSKKLDGYQGHLAAGESDIRESLDRLTIISDQTERPEALRRLTSTFQEGPETDVFDGNLIDGFIHSGSNMCFGMILILLSMMPPTFSTLVKIAGFRGDRKRGLGLLWQASKFSNINGAFAGLVLMGYYNGMLGFVDVLPTTGTGAYPRERIVELMRSFRQRYPKSRLCILEEARLLARERKLEEAVKMLEETPESSLKQVTALNWFERSMDYTYLHRDDDATEAFLKLTTLNNWSHALYYYMAGAAQVESYRQSKTKDPEKAQKHAERAEELLKKAPHHLGKRRIIGKPLPLDVFINRKIQKWEQRSKEWNVAFIDAVGISPIEEMTYMWNGYKRMGDKQLKESYERLCWTESEANPVWSKEAVDEKANLSLLKAAVHRNMKDNEKAKEVLRKQVLILQRSDLEGDHKDNWSLPVAHYEMSVNHWELYTANGSAEDLEECSKWLEKVAHWGSYDLDARYILYQTYTEIKTHIA